VNWEIKQVEVVPLTVSQLTFPTGAAAVHCAGTDFLLCFPWQHKQHCINLAAGDKICHETKKIKSRTTVSTLSFANTLSSWHTQVIMPHAVSVQIVIGTIH